MKKLFTLLLTLIATFALVTSCYGTTTLFLGKSINGGERMESEQTFLADTETTVINLTYTKLLKISAEYEPGDYIISNESCSREIWVIQASYPLISKNDDFLYFTVGNFGYSLNSYNFLQKINYETNLAIFGFDLIGSPTDKFSFGLTLQHSVNGGKYHLNKESSTDSFDINVPVDLTIWKMQLQYILTDNLGVIMNYRFLRFDLDNNPNPVKQEARNTYIGFIYRF